MDRIFIFDVDGTLTPSRLRMTEKFAKFFDKWSSKNKYYLVTGSDLDKTKEQLPIAYMDRAEAIFTCCGNQMWKDNESIYDNKFKPPKDLIKYLERQIEKSKYQYHCGNHIEDRGSLLNFSIVGRDCTQEQREEYYKWDSLNGERKEIARAIGFRWPELDAVIGGQISIDIYPKGNDKSQVLDIIKQDRLVEPDEYIFIGDGINDGGNDYPLAKLLNMKSEQPYGYAYQTEGWEHTMKILKNTHNL